jgi:hypothetical protein
MGFQPAFRIVRILRLSGTRRKVMKKDMKHLHFMKATIISAVVLFALPAKRLPFSLQHSRIPRVPI